MLKLIIRGASGPSASAKGRDEQVGVEESSRFCHVCGDTGQAAPAGVKGGGGGQRCLQSRILADRLDIGNASLPGACHPARKGREGSYALERKRKMPEASSPQEQDSAFVSRMRSCPIFLLLLSPCLDFLVLGLAPSIHQRLALFKLSPQQPGPRSCSLPQLLSGPGRHRGCSSGGLWLPVTPIKGPRGSEGVLGGMGTICDRARTTVCHDPVVCGSRTRTACLPPPRALSLSANRHQTPRTPSSEYPTLSEGFRPDRPEERLPQFTESWEIKSLLV